MFFNSHPHKEDDYFPKTYIFRKRFFNSHPHKEDDLDFFLLPSYQVLFNSHPHKEDDPAQYHHRICFCFSTHIPTRRMTFFQFRIRSLNRFSTHILTRRMTSYNFPLFMFYYLFNSHPHKEDDQIFCKVPDMQMNFQLTSSQGG